ASRELTELAEKNDIPVVNTLMGIGSISLEHPLALGMMGIHGTYCANKAVSESDLIIALGARFSDRSIGNPKLFATNAEIIHIDIDPAEIGKNVKADIPIVGELSDILNEILKDVHEMKRDDWKEEIHKWRKEHPLRYNNPENIKPQYVIEELSKATGGKCIITTEVGQHQMWTALYYKFNNPGSFITSGGLGTMGYGLPAAIGVQLGRPNELVINIAGDGSFQMNLQELATAVENKLPIKVILFNNQSLGMVKQLQHFYCDKRYSQVNFKSCPDFIKIAEGFGAEGMRISKRDEVKEALGQTLNSKGVFVLEVIVDNDENVYPMVLNGSPLSEMIGG
ncbi:MAG TPA: acetolactate synthase large subunit, partial [Thermoanaerobacterales bacterium]|nr:acetolactate synthase large subunit [Thermoanaerobacterales bacterium]